MLLEYGKNILDMREVVGVTCQGVEFFQQSVTFTLKSGSQITMNCNDEKEAHKLYERASKTLKFMAQCKKLLTGSTEVTHETVPQDPQSVKAPRVHIPTIFPNMPQVQPLPHVQPALPGIFQPAPVNPSYPYIGDNVGSDIKITCGDSASNNSRGGFTSLVGNDLDSILK